MASLNIHIVIAKRYVEKHQDIKNLEEFYNGTVAPDIASDKKISHYTNTLNCNKENLLDYFEKKVMLNRYLAKYEINNEYNKGYFLHLITDYLFFNYFFNKNYLTNTTSQEFFNNLYFSYDFIENYLKEKYNFNYQVLSKEINLKITNSIKQAKKNKNYNENSNGSNILPFNKLDEFIEYVSNIDLEKYRDKILANNKNILP